MWFRSLFHTLARSPRQRQKCAANRKQTARRLLLESLEDRRVMAAVWIDSVQNAQEGGQSGYFRLMRDDTTGPLTVSYSYDMSSSATPGQDFQYLSPSVSFASGQQ